MLSFLIQFSYQVTLGSLDRRASVDYLENRECPAKMESLVYLDNQVSYLATILKYVKYFYRIVKPCRLHAVTISVYSFNITLILVILHTSCYPRKRKIHIITLIVLSH